MAAAPTLPRVAVVIGTRPEAIKLAPLVSALRASRRYEPVVISTGQHRELLDQLLGVFELQPDLDLDLMVAGQGLSDLAGRAVQRIGAALTDLAIDLVVVQGDTTTTLAGALAGFYQRIPVVHVEAGLRTFDRYSPYPEEVNRRLVSQLADLHLAPTRQAADRLLMEGVPADAVHVTGNTVVDALFSTLARRLPYSGAEARRLSEIDASADRVLLVTAHRRESWGSGMAAIADAVAALLADHPDLVAVFPLHPNPLVRDTVVPRLAGCANAVLTEPLQYADFVRLLGRADLVLTDSGGVQEEACSLGKPTLVARDTTERPEGAEAGGLRLVGTDTATIVSQAALLLRDPAAYEQLVCRSLPFGDGSASARIVAAIDALAQTAARAPHNLVGA
ncbi:MAG: UDP-N-acetylglucosamine 2-epimerase (non-hydrolyzing) [Actinobacteria bacterium]|uniref:UDP-N-acetylglucosamine 2-epimerase (non-hydrolyzing) n=1 Tax=freshwater metagenome TaxID=449393 RepID=A0A6J6PAS0_9ZZZZ|nr:UDP-N-acetylglucosamine 2-epimerase (non-hydrolyzing) [Actinomycetota bacterium]